MSSKYMTSPAELQSRLQSLQQEYLLHGDLPAKDIELLFTGDFEGREVVWNARIMTLQEYARHHKVASDPLQFIDIRQQQGKFFIEIGLNIEQIDQAAVERTIIMIRKYKRLRPGRHEYGARSKTE